MRAINAAVGRELDHWISSLEINVVHVLAGFSLAQAVLPRLPRGNPGFWTIHNVPPQEYTFNLLVKIPPLNRVVRALYFTLVKFINARRLRNLGRDQCLLGFLQ